MANILVFLSIFFMVKCAELGNAFKPSFDENKNTTNSRDEGMNVQKMV